MRRAGALGALVAMVACVGLGLALVTGAVVVGVGAALAERASPAGGHLSLQLPGIALVLGVELVATAVIVGSRVGGRQPAEEEWL